MHRPAGLTFIEVLLIVALISIISIPLYLSYTRTQANQGLLSSTEQFITVLNRASLFARQAKDQKEWGVRKRDDTSFELISGKPDAAVLVSTNSVEHFVSIPDDFLIWFDIGTGQTDRDYTVVFENTYGRKIEVNIYETGLVESTVILNE